MNRIAKASVRERKMVFETAASKLKIPVEMIASYCMQKYKYLMNAYMEKNNV